MAHGKHPHEGSRVRRRYRTYSELDGSDRSGLPEQISAQSDRVARRLTDVARVVAVLSGKGGVGKSLISSALATALGADGRAVGLLDGDLHSPAAARMCGVRGARLTVRDDAVRPVRGPTGVSVMSMQLLLDGRSPLKRRGPAAASFAWEGPEDYRALREFLSDVEWGKLDWLIVDLPPGTRRMVDLFELVPGLDGVVAVTLPAEVAGASAERALRLAAERGIPVLGVVENMCGYHCRECGGVRPLFAGRSGQDLASAFGAPLLGSVPFDPEAARHADAGDPESLVRSTACGPAVREIVRNLEEAMRRRRTAAEEA